MRRKDREITDPDKIKKIISDSHCCRLGFCDEGKTYIVPMNFGFTEIQGRYVFYFHSAREGRKLDLIRKTGYAGFELDTNYQLKEAEVACDWTASFQSIIGSGKIEINGRTVETYFTRKTLQMIVRQPLNLARLSEKIDVKVNVQGGGVSGQAEAVRHGIARALLSVDINLRPTLKKAGFLTRDARKKERKKYGQRGARARYQYSKR